MKLRIFLGIDVGGYTCRVVGDFWKITGAVIGSGIGSMFVVWSESWLAGRLLD